MTIKFGFHITLHSRCNAQEPGMRMIIILNILRSLKADVNIIQALSMSLKRTLTRDVVRALLIIKENQMKITPIQIEAHFMAGGMCLILLKHALH